MGSTPYGLVNERRAFFSSFATRNEHKMKDRREDLLFPQVRGVVDIAHRICEFLPFAVLGCCSTLSWNWHAYISGERLDSKWKVALHIIEYKKLSEKGAYADFCMAATILRQDAQLKIEAPSIYMKDTSRLAAAMYLYKVSLTSWEHVNKAADLISAPQRKANGWYQVALLCIDQGNYTEAKKIADTHLIHHSLATSIRNKVSYLLVMNANRSLGNSQKT